MGRLKFTVKDFRSDSVPANLDGDSGSPVKRHQNVAASKRGGEEDEIGEEEMVEIDCGIADKDDQI